MATCAAALLIATSFAQAQYTRKSQASKGPRALGLLEVAPGGAAHLVPIAILYQGQFYDASAYKADPVPMALDSQTVYEAERTGASEGLFTVRDARQLKNTWIGDGTFVPRGAEVAKKKVPEFKPPTDEDDSDKPPVLRRPGSEGKPPAASSPAPEKPAASPTSAAPAPTPTLPSQETQATAPPPPDPDRPTLRRGSESGSSADHTQAPKSQPGPTALPASATSTGEKKPSGEMQIMPAISDAGGPEPQSYAYDAKPDEQDKFEKKMLAMATTALLAHKKEIVAEEIGPKAPSTPSRRRAKAAKPPQPDFQDVRLRMMDLSSSNEPVLVLTATAKLPSADNDKPSLPYYVTIVARDDIYDELHSVLSNVTDDAHLDVAPKMDFIDAVDADGDGRGELLFRKTSDAGRAFVIYRLIGNQLYPLFEGTPS
jgi:hypothetical protein